jgi:hypothetical protein
MADRNYLIVRMTFAIVKEFQSADDPIHLMCIFPFNKELLSSKIFKPALHEKILPLQK